MLATLGKRLKSLRENKGLTQRELAELVNLSQQTIGHYEVGRAKPDIETLQKFADIFNCSVDYILNRSDDPRPPAAPASYLQDAPLTFMVNTEGLDWKELERIINRAINKALDERWKKQS
ncbi:MAG: helix-turn-helix transcriptional regulator [Firmicutes bacterium]|nr:helix-turn-helix transcriptional regulator [Bacillota bacterium]